MTESSSSDSKESWTDSCTIDSYDDSWDSEFWERTLAEEKRLNEEFWEKIMADSGLFKSSSQKYFRFLNDFKVLTTNLGYDIYFHFSKNPFFENRYLIKSFCVEPDGIKSASLPIIWKRRIPPYIQPPKGKEVPTSTPYNKPNFILWYLHNETPCSDITAFDLRTKLWPSPTVQFAHIS